MVGSCTPATLVGLNYPGTGIQVARLDPATGDLTVLTELSTAGKSFAQGFSAYDPLSKHIYEFGDAGIYTIDGPTGAVLNVVGFDFNAVYNPKVNAAGQIIVVHMVPGTTGETAILDPETGALTSLAPLPYDSFAQGEGAVDVEANRIHQFADNLVVTVDGATGEALADVSTVEFYNPIVNSAGQLIGIDDHAHQIGRVDPMTGAITHLAPFSGSAGQGIRTYDPCTDRIYEIGNFTLYTFDGTTGALLSTLTMPQQNFTNFEAVY